RLSDGAAQAPVRAEANLIVGRPPEDCYGFWRNYENLPRFMRYLRSVRVTGERRSHWIAEAAGATFEWDAETTEDQPARRIAWRSLPGSQITNSGSVDFVPAPGGRGSILRVQMDYTAPARSASAFAKMV